jgi:hypothetical protein
VFSWQLLLTGGCSMLVGLLLRLSGKAMHSCASGVTFCQGQAANSVVVQVLEGCCEGSRSSDRFVIGL